LLVQAFTHRLKLAARRRSADDFGFRGAKAQSVLVELSFQLVKHLPICVEAAGGHRDVIHVAPEDSVSSTESAVDRRQVKVPENG
jgi:hypothetical protein